MYINVSCFYYMVESEFYLNLSIFYLEKLEFLQVTCSLKNIHIQKSIFWHLIWCGELNKYEFKVQYLYDVGGILAYKHQFIHFAIPKLKII